MKKYSANAINFLLIMSMLVTTFSFTQPTLAQTSGSTEEAPIVPGEYIVVYKEIPTDKPQKKALSQLQKNEAAKVAVTRETVEKKFKTKTKKKFSKALKGFSAKLSSAEVRELEANSAVEYVVPDRVIEMSATDISTQTIPTGIDRINANGLTNKGAGVNVAVIDTGIDSSHPDLAGQVVGGTNCMDSNETSYEDDNRHGTHVAGTIAALDNNIGVVGVAPEAKLWSVKVLDKNGSGSFSSVICGLDFVTANAPANGGPITVANLSLGGKGTADNDCGLKNEDPFHAAFCRARDAGVTIVVAAGNSTADVSKFVPAAYDDAVITVSALADYDGMQGFRYDQRDDSFASFTNFDKDTKKTIIDIGAPGVKINSTVLGKTYGTLSGTSMATPHVAGAAALYLAEHTGASWTEVRDALVKDGEPAGPNTHKAAAYFVAAFPGAAHLEPVLLVGPNPSLPNVSTSYPPVIDKFVVPLTPVNAGQSVSVLISTRYASTTTIEADGITTVVTHAAWSVKPLKTTTYKVVATNPLGSVSATAVVTVKDAVPPRGGGKDITRPVVTLIEPAATTKKVNPGTVFNLTATASDNVGVVKVDFYVNETLICSTTQAPYTCAWNVPLTANQSYTVKAVATDAAGNVASASRPVKSKGATTPPPEPIEDITITDTTFSPTTIGKNSKTHIESLITFNKEIPEADRIRYFLKNSKGEVLHGGRMHVSSVATGSKYQISIDPILRPKVSGESYVFEIEVQTKRNKVIYEKTSTSKLLVTF